MLLIDLSDAMNAYFKYMLSYLKCKVTGKYDSVTAEIQLSEL